MTPTSDIDTQNDAPVSVSQSSSRSMRRLPTPAERASELVTARALLGDLAIFLTRIPLIFLTGSLTLLSDGARSVFSFSASLYALYVLHAIHRGRFYRYQFGVAKIEQIVVIILGLGMVVGGLLLGNRIVSTLLEATAVASPFGLTLAAVFNAVNLVKNSVNWFEFRAMARASMSDIHDTQLRVRSTMLLTSLFLQVTLTVAALAKDDVVAISMDTVGGAFIAGLMMCRGARMLAHALPDVVDAPGSADLIESIEQTIEEIIPDQEIVRLRTRRGGRATFAEIMLDDSAWTSLASLPEVGAAISESLAKKGKNVEVAIVVARLSETTGGLG